MLMLIFSVLGGFDVGWLWTAELPDASIKGYPDIGWNPVEGERYLDFLRFAVFCNGRMNLRVF